MVGSQARVHYNSRTEKISISNSKSGDVFQNKIHPNCPIYANTCPSSLEFWKEITVMVESHDWSLRSFPHICNCSWSQPEVKASVEQGAGRGGSKLQEKLVWGSNYWSVKEHCSQISRLVGKRCKRTLESCRSHRNDQSVEKTHRHHRRDEPSHMDNYPLRLLTLVPTKQKLFWNNQPTYSWINCSRYMNIWNIFTWQEAKASHLRPSTLNASQ